MDESVICIEEPCEVIDLSETGNDIGEDVRNNEFEFEDSFVRKRQTRSQTRKAVVEFVDLSKEPDIDINKLSSEKSDVPKSRLSSDLSCPVCYEKLLNVSVKTTMCGHVFCSTCIETVVREKRNCPKCRKKLTMKSLIPIYL